MVLQKWHRLALVLWIPYLIQSGVWDILKGFVGWCDNLPASQHLDTSLGPYDALAYRDASIAGQLKENVWVFLCSGKLSHLNPSPAMGNGVLDACLDQVMEVAEIVMLGQNHPESLQGLIGYSP
jgi:hypothetical protein